MIMNFSAAKRASLALATSTALLLAASGAQAHTHLVAADPAPNAAVASPKTISLRFSERFEPKFSGFELTMSDGTKAATGPASVDPHDAKTLTAAVTAPLAPGAYRVTWHAVGSDGHRMQGFYTFTAR
jgi:hypothetical protein